MRTFFSAKVILAIVFIALAAIGTFWLKSPDGQYVFTLTEFWVVVTLAVGITTAAKIIQKNRLDYRANPAPMTDVLTKLWGIFDPTQGVFSAIISFLLVSALVYFRVPGFDFALWVSYHGIFLVYFNTVNVGKK